jgi:hypothetical protein
MTAVLLMREIVCKVDDGAREMDDGNCGEV